jgi:hypothetical protein
MGKPNRGGLGKPLGWGEGWKGSRSAADSHIFFLAIRREFGGHKNFVLHPRPLIAKIFHFQSRPFCRMMPHGLPADCDPQ